MNGTTHTPWHTSVPMSTCSACCGCTRPRGTEDCSIAGNYRSKGMPQGYSLPSVQCLTEQCLCISTARGGCCEFRKKDPDFFRVRVARLPPKRSQRADRLLCDRNTVSPGRLHRWTVSEQRATLGFCLRTCLAVSRDHRVTLQLPEQLKTHTHVGCPTVLRAPTVSHTILRPIFGIRFRRTGGVVRILSESIFPPS